MGKAIIDLIGEFVSISGNSTVDSIIFAIIGVISFMVAFGIVGWIFDALGTAVIMEKLAPSVAFR